MTSSSSCIRSQYRRSPAVAAQHHARGRPGGEDPLGGAVGGADEPGLGEVDGPDPQVVLGVHRTGLGCPPGLGEQPARVGGAQPGRPGDQVGVLGHGGGVLDPAFAAVEGFAGVDGDQTAGRVEDVGDGPLAGVGVPDGVGQHGRDALLGGEADRPGGQAQRAGPGAGAAVVDGLQAQVVPVDLPPGREQARGPVRAARGEGPAHFGAGAEQDVHAARAAQLLPGQERDAGCSRRGRR